jgi:hypothetical protein
MTYEEVTEVLKEISDLHLPELSEESPAAEKIAALEDHLLWTARARGILESARIGLEDAYEGIDERWRNVEGYEVYLHGKPKSQEEVNEAKRQADKELFIERRLCMKLMRQVGNQIRRLEKDDAVCSRAYTMLTGS